MSQITWRAPQELVERVRRQASDQGRSLNDWVTTVLDAASDPETTSDEAHRVRERLSRAGLLEPEESPAPPRPPSAEFEAARKAAGRGPSLSSLVDEGRG